MTAVAEMKVTAAAPKSRPLSRALSASSVGIAIVAGVRRMAPAFGLSVVNPAVYSGNQGRTLAVCGR